MPFLSDGDYSSPVEYGIREWWDETGTHHEGAPTPDDLLDHARQLTVEVRDGEGNDFYFTDFSPDGWLDEELEADVDDAYSHYAMGEQ